MIRAKNLWKSFETAKGRLDIIRGINLEIAAGEFVSIIGKSGSGKTTLLSLLAGLDRPTKGEIELEGQRIDQLDEEQMVPFRRKTLGFIFQAYHLIPTLNLLDNVILPARMAGNLNAEAAGRDLLAQVGLQDRLESFPTQLSGGEQQRASICRALINDPKIIFADEPTGNLDSLNGERVLDLLITLRGNRTLVLVTHDEALSRRANRRIELIDGIIANEEFLRTQSA